MDNRKYNIYFHTHTISGIIICAVLYVMFFAGSFAFFKDDIAAWQKNSSFVAQHKATQKDFQLILDSLAKHHPLKGRDFDFTMQRTGAGAFVSMSASHDSTLKKKPKAHAKPAVRKRGGGGRRGDGDSEFFTYDFNKKKQAEYNRSYDMGEFLYRLHFLAPLNEVPIRLGTPFGYLLAGIVSFIFVFALITGLLLHWDKMVSNFFVFRPWNKWKTVWTDLHTALGVIGFPFQFVFAVTGVILIANFALMAPYTQLIYKGKAQALYHDLEYTDSTQYAYTYTPLKTAFDLNGFVEKADKKWAGAELYSISVKNYLDSNMHIILQAKPLPGVSFAGAGKLVYRVHDGKVLFERSPTNGSSYVNKVRSTIYHLHFGDFGGRPVRVMYFVLGIMGCIVINSGVLIWLVARDKNNVPERKRKFNFWTANIFLASSMSLLPVLATTMCVLLFVKQPDRSTIYHLFFYSWLALGIYFTARRNLEITNRQSFLLSAITCLLVPVLHGIVRGNWVWNTYRNHAYDLLFIDVLFIALSVLSAVIYLKVRKRDKQPKVDAKPAARVKKPQVEVVG